MANNHNWIVPYYKGVPDLWNSKPPMQIWLQVLLIKTIGLNELAIRLPSAFASVFSALLLFFFIKKRFSITFAFLVFLVFITSGSVSTFHTGRTGDADALLSFFLLCTCITFYQWVFENNKLSIFYFFVFLSFAFLSKSIAALLFIPSFVITILITKKIFELLKSRWFYIGFVFFITVIFGYLFLREKENSGYVNYVLNNDLGRIGKVIESHKEPFDFYINNLFEYRFTWLILCLPGALLLWIKIYNKKVAVYLFSLILCYLLIISISTTKLEWYDLPIIPFLSVLSAYSLYILITSINSYENKNNLLLICLIFVLPLYYSFRNSYKSEIKSGEKKLESLTEYVFKNKDKSSLNGAIIITQVFDRPLYFYKYYLNEKSQNFEIQSTTNSLKSNQIIIVSDDSIKTSLDSLYQYEVLDSMKNVLRIKIINLKKIISN